MAVMRDIDANLGPDRFLFVLGDAVSIGPNPSECLRRLRAEDNTRFVMGNNDRYVIERLYDSPEEFHQDAFDEVPAWIRDNLRWTRENLSEEDVGFIGNWPRWAEIECAGKLVFGAHGSRLSDERTIQDETDKHRAEEQWDRYRLYLFGHTHLPHLGSVPGTLFLNPGSVGSPFDGNPHASYAIVDLAADPIAVDIRRVAYDVEETVMAIRSLGTPRAAEIVPVLRNGSL